MTAPRTVTFLMEPGLRESAAAGQHNFIARLGHVLRQAGHAVDYQPFGAPVQGRTLSHMKAPPDTDGLVFRRVYHYPFWQIERVAERWDWDVARAEFDPRAVPDVAAQTFTRFWRDRLFGDLDGRVRDDGFIYVPLQGRLLERRSFQRCSPIEMIRACLDHAPDRRVIAALHPNETYSATEIAALEKLAAKVPRLQIRNGGMAELLPRCSFVVTQNSSVAFNGYFLRKPALLFADIDFHHIAIPARMENLDGSFRRVATHCPNFARYIHWFWQQRSINAGRPEAEDRIAARLRRFGWLN